MASFCSGLINNSGSPAASPEEQRVIPRVDVVYLTYNDKRKQPSISMDNVCTVSLYELKKHRHAKREQKYEMSRDAYKHYRWYNCVLTGMLRVENGPMLLRTFHWYIETSNVEAFRVDGVLYEAVSLIVGPEVEHWYCARRGSSTHGSRVRLQSKKWENSSEAVQAKARVADCMVPPADHRAFTMAAVAVSKRVRQRRPRRTCCARRLSLGTICEER